MTGEVRPRPIEELSVPEETATHVEETAAERSIKTSDIHIWLGINISIVLMLTIFGVLLFLPLRLLLHTTYYTRSQAVVNNDTTETAETAADNATFVEAVAMIPIDHRKMRRCPRFEYKERLMSVFVCDYDRNCTYRRIDPTKDPTRNVHRAESNDAVGNKSEESSVSKETDDKNLTECTEDSGKDRRMKSVAVAGRILVTMLLMSAIAALVEVLRIRFARDKESSKAGNASSRYASTIEIPMKRRFIPRQPMNSQRSFEMQGMHRSALRLLGAKPPPLIRRSSFPSQQAKQTAGPVSVTPNNRLSRRQSAEAEEEIGTLINALHHRTRLIRRH
ncbi:uncharacterized protein LOC117227828 [Megalopta genalis]|uniref:uncharacterized protein LOC117227828 n=1 Tax=Megalopta genalis TaxID=115081 RepID=UPI00144343AD|nr:uncharacterized protein LOC117227828 [Megalopta genalis]